MKSFHLAPPYSGEYNKVIIMFHHFHCEVLFQVGCVRVCVFFSSCSIIPTSEEILPFVSFIFRATLPFCFVFIALLSSCSFAFIPPFPQLLGSSFHSQTNWNNLRQKFLRFVLKVVCDISNGNNNNDGSMRVCMCVGMHIHLKTVSATAAFNFLQFVLKIC